MDAARALAEQAIDAVWDEAYRHVLVDASPMRPGRGGRAVQPNRRRPAAWSVVERCSLLVRSLELGLGSGKFDREGARRQIEDAGLGEFIRLAGSREEAVEAVAGFYAAGYHLWEVSGGPDAALVPVLRLGFATRKELT